MAEFAEVVRRRRMTRHFSAQPIEPSTIDHLVDLASRAPSAGKSQGWHLIVLDGPDTAGFWDICLASERRSAFAWPTLLEAPVLIIVATDPAAYLERYSEPDKARSGLGESVDRWPAPYWTIDTAMATMTLLLAAEDLGLGALFFGIFQGEDELRRHLDIPSRIEILGAVALGHKLDGRRGSSARRPRRGVDDIIHHRRW